MDLHRGDKTNVIPCHHLYGGYEGCETLYKKNMTLKGSKGSQCFWGSLVASFHSSDIKYKKYIIRRDAMVETRGVQLFGVQKKILPSRAQRAHKIQWDLSWLTLTHQSSSGFP